MLFDDFVVRRYRHTRVRVPTNFILLYKIYKVFEAMTCLLLLQRFKIINAAPLRDALTAALRRRYTRVYCVLQIKNTIYALEQLLNYYHQPSCTYLIGK